MIYESLIENIDLVHGDSSAIYFLGLPDDTQLDDGNWNARYTISSKFGDINIINRVLPVNSGSNIGDTYTIGTKFVFQILPAESALLEGGKEYDCAVEIWNTTLNFNNEVARFKINVLIGN